MNCDFLEIIIITFNRKINLQKTLDQLLAINSPARHCRITILDNKSDDGSTELIKSHSDLNLNIRHIVHQRNIGGNSNIARALEIAISDYLWILCDDDDFNWSNWNELLECIEIGYDLIVVANYAEPEKSTSNFLKQLTFVPAGIYKTELITDTVLQNAIFNAPNLFPHLALACKVLNEKRSFRILKSPLVRMVPNLHDASYTRGLGPDRHPYMDQMFWEIGYCNSLQMINNERMRSDLMKSFSLDETPFPFNFLKIIRINSWHYNGSLKNMLDFLAAAPNVLKFVIVFGLVFHFFERYIFGVHFDKEEGAIRFRLFGRLKTRIRIRARRA